jgi:hypothetical protein
VDGRLRGVVLATERGAAWLDVATSRGTRPRIDPLTIRGSADAATSSDARDGRVDRCVGRGDTRPTGVRSTAWGKL